MTDPLKNIRIVLCETQHPGNIGSAARAMKTMGLSELYLVNPRQFPDKQADWMATRAVDVLQGAKVCSDLDTALQGVGLAAACTARSREIAAPAEPARNVARQLVDVARTQPAALVFGNEVSGLSTEQVKRCQRVTMIPADASHNSLNLAAAVQVYAYECRLHAVDEPLPNKARELASHEELERFYAHLERELIEVGFLSAKVNTQVPQRLMQRVRRLFSRTALDAEEVRILRGIVRTLRQPKKRD